MTAAICRHGAPYGVAALALLLADERQQHARADYAANMLWAIARTLGGDRCDIPSYAELTQRAAAPQDRRTGRQIADDLIATLAQRQHDRRGKHTDETI